MLYFKNAYGPYNAAKSTILHNQYLWNQAKSEHVKKLHALWETDIGRVREMGMLPYPLLVQDFQQVLSRQAFPVSQAALCLQGLQGGQQDPKDWQN